MKTFILLFLLSIQSSVAQSETNTGLYPLSGNDPDLPAAELSPLSPMIRGARVVGLGELSHGTQDDTTRDRIIRYLVEKEGFRIILAEFPMEQSLNPEVQNYFRTCQGDIRKLFRFNYGTFQTLEMLRMFDWLCKYNVAHPRDTVSLIGADILYQNWIIRQRLEKLHALFGEDTKYKTIFESVRLNCFGARYATKAEWAASPEYKQWVETNTIPKEPHEKCVADTKLLDRYLRANESKITAKFGRAEASYQLLLPNTIQAFDYSAALYPANITLAGNIRDKQIYTNFLTLWKIYGLQKKTILLAHNYHISKLQSKTENIFWPKVVSAGEHLSRLLGPAYKTIGLTSYKMHSYYDPKPPVLPVSSESLEVQLNKMQPSTILIDPRGSFVRQKRQWFMMADNNEEHPDGARMIPSEQYDAILYTRESLDSHYVKP